MNRDIQSIVIDFNDSAARIYSNSLHQFLDSVHHISRHRDENVFKLQAAKYSYALKLQLNDLVKKTSEASQPDLYDMVHAALSARVDYYLQQFKLRWNAL